MRQHETINGEHCCAISPLQTQQLPYQYQLGVNTSEFAKVQTSDKV